MDSIGDLMDNPQAAELIETYLPQLKNNAAMKVAKMFSLFEILNHMSSSFDEDTVQELNQKLTELHKEKPGRRESSLLSI